MRRLNHITLDELTTSKKLPNSYWALNYLLLNKDLPLFLNNVSIYKKFNSSPQIKNNLLYKNQKKHTLCFNNMLLEKSQNSEYNINNLKSLLFTKNSNEYLLNSKYYNYSQLLNINFLRKERLYTKLKYSRSPAYDIVSGGMAAILAGFLGFLISEKYGAELVDSGDFYFLFMYIVFLVFALKPLLTKLNIKKGLVDLFSLKELFNFLKTLLFLFMYLFR